MKKILIIILMLGGCAIINDQKQGDYPKLKLPELWG